jgi:hypothetical protein
MNWRTFDDCVGDSIVTVYLISNISYNMSLVFVLKWGSAALMVVVGAVIMPLSNVAFTMPAIMGMLQHYPFGSLRSHSFDACQY